MNISNTSTTVPNQPLPGITTFTRTTYSILATVAIIGNILVILVFVWDKKLLKKSYNMLILSLAISDVLTAFLLITNPAFVLGDAFPYPTNHVLGDIFCRVIWSRTFLFQLVVFSAYICVALAMERWYAIIKPYKYSETFNKKRTLIYIFLVWLWSVILCGTSLFEVAYVSSNSPNRRCKWQPYSSKQPVRGIVGIIQVFLRIVLPSLTMLFLFVHMVYMSSKLTIASVESRAKLRGKMTRMVGAACIMLIVCFAPNQINYAMAMAGKTRLDTNLHHVLSLLAFVNSCLNPLIYGLSNKNYRHGYLKILFLVCPKGRWRKNKVKDGRVLNAWENVQDTSSRERNTEESRERESQENNV